MGVLEDNVLSKPGQDNLEVGHSYHLSLIDFLGHPKNLVSKIICIYNESLDSLKMQFKFIPIDVTTRRAGR